MANTSRNLNAAIACAVERYQDRLSLGDLAKAAALPTNTLTRMFNRRYGMSPMRWVWRFRTILAAECIARAPEWSLAEIATHCGFTSAAHFSRRFRELFQESPSRFRANYHERPDGAGMPELGDMLQGARQAAAERAMRRPSRVRSSTTTSTVGEN
jgi:transcriptional regulator GlxA family with amidase domain